LLMPCLRSPSYCLSSFTLGPWSLAIATPPRSFVSPLPAASQGSQNQGLWRPSRSVRAAIVMPVGEPLAAPKPVHLALGDGRRRPHPRSPGHATATAGVASERALAIAVAEETPERRLQRRGIA